MKYLIVLFAVVVSFILGVLYGFNQGVKNFAALDSVLVGYMNTAQVNRLKSGAQEDIKNVSGYLSVGIDNGIGQYVWYQDEGNHFLSYLFLREHLELIDRSIKGLAIFRKQNPEIYFPDLLQNKDEKQEYIELYNKRKNVIEKFGSAEQKK